MEVESAVKGELPSAFMAWGNSSSVLSAVPYKDLGRARLVFNESVLCVHAHVCELPVQCLSLWKTPASPSHQTCHRVAVFYLWPCTWP